MYVIEIDIELLFLKKMIKDGYVFLKGIGLNIKKLNDSGVISLAL